MSLLLACDIDVSLAATKSCCEVLYFFGILRLLVLVLELLLYNWCFDVICNHQWSIYSGSSGPFYLVWRLEICFSCPVDGGKIYYGKRFEKSRLHILIAMRAKEILPIHRIFELGSLDW